MGFLHYICSQTIKFVNIYFFFFFIFKFDINKCIECKKILNRNDKSKEIYEHKCSYSRFIGNCTNLYYKLKPNNYFDFYEKELKYAEENHSLPVEERGLTYEEFYMLAHKYKVLLEDCTTLKYDISVYFYALVCHAIVETFVGQKKEETIMKYISDKGFTVNKVEGKKDAKYGVDIEVFGKGQHFYVQVKPISFFKSEYPNTHKSRIEACRKREEVLNLEGIDTYYVIYDLDWKTSQFTWVNNKNGGILFKINDLFGYDKDNIKSTLIRYQLPTEQITIDF